VEADTWKGKENLENTKEAIEEFEKKYRRDMENIRRQEREEGTFRREELPGRFMARKLFGWLDKRYDKEYWAKLERNWRRWKERTKNNGDNKRRGRRDQTRKLRSKGVDRRR